MMKKYGVIIGALLIVLALIIGFLCFSLKAEKEKERALSAEYEYTIIFTRTKMLLDDMNQQIYDTPQKAYYKTNFILGQIDLKSWKKDVEKCLLDNGISYETIESEELMKKCGQPFVEKVINFAQNQSITEDNFIEAYIAQDLEQMIQKTHDKMQEGGFSEQASKFAPLITYTRLDVHQCVKTASNCFNEGDGNQKISDCLTQCYSEYLNHWQDVLKDYEYRAVK